LEEETLERFITKWNGTTEVALKQLKASEHFEEFIQEASMLQSLNHPNIVRFFGIHSTSNEEHFLVMEYMRKGSLDGVLQTEKNQLNLVDLLSMTKDAASGMVYLHQKGIVHRDLALRNLLVEPTVKPGTKYIVKISDFGMARTMTNKGYYKTESKTIPVRWCSPEALQFGKFSFHSDVWAFGVVMWEIFSYGMVPYYEMQNSEVLEKVIGGYRLPSPENCPPDIYGWIVSCWNREPVMRPSFKELYERIEAKWIETVQIQPAKVTPNTNLENLSQTSSSYTF